MNAVFPVHGGPWSNPTGPVDHNLMKAWRCCLLRLKTTWPSSSKTVYASSCWSVGSSSKLVGSGQVSGSNSPAGSVWRTLQLLCAVLQIDAAWTRRDLDRSKFQLLADLQLSSNICPVQNQRVSIGFSRIQLTDPYPVLVDLSEDLNLFVGFIVQGLALF